MADRPEVFLDTSALFAGLWSETGGARQILRLAEIDLVTVKVSPHVLAEIEAVIRRKAPDMLGRLAILLDRVGITAVAPAPRARYRAALELAGHPGDARVLADAWEAGVDYFVTLDRQHFLKNKKTAGQLPFPIGTPGDFLIWYRRGLIGMESGSENALSG